MGLLLLMSNSDYSPAELVKGRQGGYYDFRASTGVDVVTVRRSNDSAESDFTLAELRDGTAAAWVGNGNTGFLKTIYDLSGNGEHASQTTTGSQPIIVSSTGRHTYEVDFDTGDFISPLLAQSRNLNQFVITAVINQSNATAQNIFAITLAGVSTYRLLIANNLAGDDLTYAYFGTGAITGSFGINKLGVFGAKNVITVGVQDSKLFLYWNNGERQEFALSSLAGTASIDLDIGGRAAGTLNGYLSAWVHCFNASWTDAEIKRLHRHFMTKFKVKDAVLASGWPKTVVDDTAIDASSLANTGLSYDADNDEIVVSQWNSTGAYNALLRYDRATMTVSSTVPIDEAIQPSIQENFVINGVYYVGGGTATMNKFDEDGNHLGAAVLPVTPGWQNAVSYSMGYIWAANTTGLYKIDPVTLTVAETYTVFPGDEGLFVTEKGVWRGNTNRVRLYSWQGETLLEIRGDETEGVCVDPDGAMYVCRDEYFHGGTPNGNRLWKYDVTELG